ncbi:hypothetical protein HYH03_009516 [Edaphochlamys debaryana]|uniref:Sodium/calcium exchanger membrane region domain-containing protein n=1 Tax=Edaphochlamys debaryana TaxID=47281 RepID=A0A835Y1D2_9CHLO|nr:hypothetical protein HYH03_009516 [Edaphochlamys debaryana]|eukprot:KAG2492276.1 hypothetical protein HYH03_009516 [Edaphochlamys debaryana]
MSRKPLALAAVSLVALLLLLPVAPAEGYRHSHRRRLLELQGCRPDSVPPEERCAYVKGNSACSDSDGFIPYLELHYCLLKGSQGLSTALFLLWIGTLFGLMILVAERFFCPSLEIISEYLRLPPCVAGATLLSFGNGAPDVFTQLAAISAGDDSEAASPASVAMALSEPLGSGLFVGNIVFALVVLFSGAREVRVERSYFLKDCLFYLGGVAIVFVYLLTGRVSSAAVVVLAAYYVLFLASTILLSRNDEPVHADPRLHEVPHKPRRLDSFLRESFRRFDWSFRGSSDGGVLAAAAAAVAAAAPDGADAEAPLLTRSVSGWSATLDPIDELTASEGSDGHVSGDASDGGGGRLAAAAADPVAEAEFVAILEKSAGTYRAPLDLVMAPGPGPGPGLGPGPGPGTAAAGLGGSHGTVNGGGHGAVAPGAPLSASLSGPGSTGTGGAANGINGVNGGVGLGVGGGGGGVSRGKPLMRPLPYTRGANRRSLETPQPAAAAGASPSGGSPSGGSPGGGSPGGGVDVTCSLCAWGHSGGGGVSASGHGGGDRTLSGRTASGRPPGNMEKAWRWLERPSLAFLSIFMPRIATGTHARYRKVYAVLLPPLVPTLLAALHGSLLGARAPPGGVWTQAWWQVGTSLGAVVSCCAAAFYPRKGHLHGYAAGLATAIVFAEAMVLLDGSAGELVSAAVALGQIYGISPSLLGATLLAWGNSVSDLVSNVTLARDGLPSMAITACFASPMFVLLAGLVTSLAYATRHGVMDLPDDLALRVLYGCALVILTMWALVVPLWFRFRLTRTVGFIALGCYACFQAVYITSVLHDSGSL